MKAVCIFLAEGFEEMEAMFPLDISWSISSMFCLNIYR